MQKGFLGSVFDFSFSSFVTTRIVVVLYVLALLGSGLAALLMLGTGAFSLIRGDVVPGVISIVLAPIVGTIYVLLARVYLEIVVVLFRVAENTAMIAQNTAR